MSSYSHSSPHHGPSSPIEWMAKHPVAAGLLTMVMLFGGFLMMRSIRQEVFPQFNLDLVTVRVDYPGSTPQDVEKGIILVVEEAVQAIEGVVEITSIAAEGSGTVTIEYDPSVDSQKFYQEVQQEIDRIRTFPLDAEKPIVSLASQRREVLDILIYGNTEEGTLRNIAEEVRDQLLQDSEIHQVDVDGARRPEIHIRPRMDDLRRYGLTFESIARVVARSAVEVPGGSIKEAGGEILVRFDERKDWAVEFGTIPVITTPQGAVVRLRDIAEVNEGFEDVDILATFEGQRSISLEVYSIGQQGPLEVSAAVRRAMEQIEPTLPSGISYSILDDRSDTYGQRLSLLTRNAAMGLLLVLLLLAVFLEIRVAMWVTLSIPIAFLGSFLVFPNLDVSINMISMFAFIIALGIVVDNAIVVGENVYDLRQSGLEPMDAAVRGTQEVATPVVFSVLTNLVGFIPLMLIPGAMGKIWGVIPVVVNVIFLTSLLAALAILPNQLGNMGRKPRHGIILAIHHLQQRVSEFIRNVIYTGYAPFLDRCIRSRYLVLSLAIAILVFVMAWTASGRMGLVLMPKVEADTAVASVVMPLGTPMNTMVSVMSRLEKAAREVISENGEKDLSLGVFGRIWENQIDMRVYLQPPGVRPISTEKLTRLWRDKAGEIPGTERLRFEFDRGGPGGGPSVTVELSHTNITILEEAAQKLALIIEDYPVARDIDDGYNPGKDQLQINLREEGRSLGLTSQDVASQVRAAFYGSQALRQQRGRDEVRVLVTLPESDNSKLHSLEEMLIAAPSGAYVPLKQIATWEWTRSYTSISRRDGRRTLAVTAFVTPDDQTSTLMESLSSSYLPSLVADYPGLSYSFEGRQSDMRKSLSGLGGGFLIVMLIIYALLAIPFGSYFQPLVVMTAIPFGLVGAIIGHWIMGYNLSVISLMGIIALSGVVINGSLIMIAFANDQRLQGKPAFEAIHNAGVRRFRPILLTTLTTFGGLAPMIFETSRQARFMIPMAISLGYGLVFATAITLVLVPSLYMILEDIQKLISNRSSQSRPASVNWAIRLLYATLVIGIIRALIVFSQSGVSLIDILMECLIVGFLWLLVFMIGKRKNWARITFLVFLLIGTPFAVFWMIQELTYQPKSGIVMLLQFTMNVVSVVYLFQKESSSWFNEGRKISRK